MNIPKLKGKIVERGLNVETLAYHMEIDRSTLYRKLTDAEKFTVGEVQKLKDVLGLTTDEASDIFFA